MYSGCPNLKTYTCKARTDCLLKTTQELLEYWGLVDAISTFQQNKRAMAPENYMIFNTKKISR